MRVAEPDCPHRTVPAVRIRAPEAFPEPVWTLDAAHLASMDLLRRQGQAVSLARYDTRLIEAPRALKFAIEPA
jgi:hypothetical protein